MSLPYILRLLTCQQNALFSFHSKDFLSSPQGEKLVDVEGIMTTVILGSQHVRLVRTASSTLSSLWNHRSDAVEATEKILLKLVDQSLHVSCSKEISQNIRFHKMPSPTKGIGVVFHLS